VACGQGPGGGNGGQLSAVPGVELLQSCRHRLGPGGDALLGGGFELAELAGYLRHQGGRLLGIVPHMGIPIAMGMFDLAMAIPIVVLVGIGGLGRPSL
jgi:hypothetical protein